MSNRAKRDDRHWYRKDRAFNLGVGWASSYWGVLRRLGIVEDEVVWDRALTTILRVAGYVD